MIDFNLLQIKWRKHSWKVSKCGVFSCPYFPASAEYGEILRTRKNSVFGHFSRSTKVNQTTEKTVSILVLFDLSHFSGHLNKFSLFTKLWDFLTFLKKSAFLILTIFCMLLYYGVKANLIGLFKRGNIQPYFGELL